MKSKKLLTGILSAALVFASLAFTAFAEDLNFDVSDSAGLKNALESVNSADGGTVKINILNDIDATNTEYNIAWDSYKTSGADYIEIDGGNHKISNLNSMLIATTWTGKSLSFNNLTIDGANIVHDDDKQDGIAAFVGNVSCIENVSFNNCKLINSKINTGNDWTGGFIGYAAGYSNENDGPVYTTIVFNGCEASDNEILCKGSVGGIMGHSSGDSNTEIDLDNVVVSGNTIKCTGSSTEKAGAICGTIGAGSINVASTALNNNTVISSDKTIETFYGRQGSSTGKADIINNTLTVNGNAYTDSASFVNYSARKAKIGNKYYETLADAVEAANEGDTITIIGTINVTDEKELHNGTKAITIQGDTSDGEDVLHFKGAVAIHGAKVTFKDLTMQWPESTDYVGLQHADELIYDNCTIKGKVFLYGNKEIFNKCNFVQTVVDYNVWTYGARLAEFNNCKFNCLGKSVLIYSEGNDDPVDYLNKYVKEVVINNCEFNATQLAKGKAAIEIGSNFAPFDVTINNSSADGFDKGSRSGNALYNVKAFNEKIDSSVDPTSLKVDNKEKATRSTTFSSMTDSGIYTVENEKFGVMRFSFKVVPMGNVSAVGIKYAKGSDIAQAISGSVLSKSADLNVFYGDLVNIDPNENSKYYAIAYVTTTDGNTAWSDVVECTLDTNKEFDNYKVGGAE